MKFDLVVKSGIELRGWNSGELGETSKAVIRVAFCRGKVI